MKLKKNTKKGFTIVELVIVIAVIAILAAVLIPTFSGLVEKANKNAALTEAKNNMTNDLVEATGDYANMASDKVVKLGDKTYIIANLATVTTGAETTESAPAAPTGKTYYDASTGLAVSAGTSLSPSTTYYVVDADSVALNGTYSDSKWSETVNDYTCTFDVASGEWTVVKQGA